MQEKIEIFLDKSQTNHNKSQIVLISQYDYLLRLLTFTIFMSNSNDSTHQVYYYQSFMKGFVQHILGRILHV